MKFSMRSRYDLLALAIISLLFPLLIGIDYLYELRVVLGAVYSLFFPGYALMATLFPGRDSLNFAERLAFSAGLSVVVVSLIGLGLNYTIWGVRLNAVLLSLTAFIVVCCGAAYYRWRGLAPQSRLVFELRLETPSWDSMAQNRRIRLIVLVLSVVALAGLIGYAFSLLTVEDRYTQFYVLNANETIRVYPSDVVVDEPTTVVLGIINHEYSDVQYYIEQVGDTDSQQIASPHLSYGETWEQRHTFTLSEPQGDGRVTFLLYREGDDEPYRSLYLWITAR